MNRLILTVALASVLGFSASAHAEITPKRGQYDARVRVVTYNPYNVIRLTTFYGVATGIQFGEDEVIRDIAVGDDQAWSVKPRGSHMFLKPIAKQADTNITVVTTKRTYHFIAVVQPRDIKDPKAWSDPDLVYALSFRYPQDEAAKRQAQAEVDRQKINEHRIQQTLAARKQPKGGNNDYWVAGPLEVSPTAAHDDGRFIYLTFSNNRDMPAVYEQDAAGNESLIDTSVDGNTIIVNRKVRKLVLRKGEYVACVVNKAFDINGGLDNTNGTIAPNIERVIKGAQ